MTWLFIYTTVRFVNKPLKRFIGISETQETCLNCFKDGHFDKVIDRFNFYFKSKNRRRYKRRKERKKDKREYYTSKERIRRNETNYRR